MGTKKENRAKLKALQAIVIGRGDDEVDQAIEDLRAHLDKLGTTKRRGLVGRDRKERGGRDRSE
jgi:hypothetical protein